ncbi:MAG: PadR family transcriptional regulator [Candidatus Thorarchaeota archaeon]|jgi:PadR family transcriptional regulator PadR
MRKSKLKRAILKLFGKHEFHGYQILGRFEMMGIFMGASRLYKVLDEMLEDGLLTGKWIKSKSGPKKRIYQLTEAGRDERTKILMDAIRTVHDFYIEFLLDFPPEENMFNKISDILIENLSEQGIIACFTDSYTLTLEQILTNLQNRIENRTSYLVIPSQNSEGHHFGNWRNLDGTCDNMPMKNDSLDLLVLSRFNDIHCQDSCLAEWQRVVCPSGTLAVITPTYHTQKSETFVSVGRFVEMHEHQEMNMQTYDQWQLFKGRLKEYFGTVTQKTIAEVTILLATKPRS